MGRKKASGAGRPGGGAGGRAGCAAETRGARVRRAVLAAAASTRLRFVDPTTCERDYTADEVEFMMAMQEYKRASGRIFPAWSEVLGVLHDLGYAKTARPPAKDDASR